MSGEASSRHEQGELIVGAQALGVVLSNQQSELLLDYLSLLLKWNKAYNLTAIRDSREMVKLHLLDSLALMPELGLLPEASCSQGARWLDVGSGGGLPGIVLAIMCPQIEFTLMDSNGKKTRFLQQVKLELALDNVSVVKSRVESFQAESESEKKFAVICSRAFASLQDMINWSQHLLAPQGVYFAMKGQEPRDELQALAANIQLVHSKPLQVPGVEGERHIIILQPQEASNSQAQI